MPLVRLLEYGANGIKPIRIVPDKKILKYILQGEFGIVPLDNEIGAICALRVAPGTPSYASCYPHILNNGEQKHQKSIYGKFLVGKFYKGWLTDLQDAEVFKAKSYILAPIVAAAPEEEKEPDYVST